MLSYCESGLIVVVAMVIVDRDGRGAESGVADSRTASW